MAARMQNAGGFALRSPAGPLAPAIPALDRRIDARRVAEFGRAMAIWLPVFVLTAEQLSSIPEVLLVSSLAAAVWFFTLRSAFRAVPFILGSVVPAVVGTLTGLVAISALNVWSPLSETRLPVSTLALMAISVFGLVTLWEAWRRQFAAKRRVLVVGTSSWADDLAESAEHAHDVPFRVVGIVDDEAHSDPDSGVPVLGKVADLSDIVEAQRPDLIVLTDGNGSGRALESLLDVASSGFKVVGVTHFFEHVFGWVPLRHLTSGWFMSILHLHQRTYSRFAKRALDVVVACLGLLLAAPLVPFIVLVVKRTPGRVIYAQTRVGEGGKLFTMYKFRTMEEDAEEPGVPVYAEENDPRVTPSGRLLRRTHLDELPQLWNVLKGEMSIVGPRPHATGAKADRDLYQNVVQGYFARHRMKPGVTGWAQINGWRGETDPHDKLLRRVEHDLY